METTRKHFEAALGDIAKLYGVGRDSLRDTLKWWLYRNGFIATSTSELSNAQLSALADIMGKFHWRMGNTPPSERAVLDFNQIFKDLPDNLTPKQNEKNI